MLYGACWVSQPYNGVSRTLTHKQESPWLLIQDVNCILWSSSRPPTSARLCAETAARILHACADSRRMISMRGRWHCARHLRTLSAGHPS